MIGSLLNFLSAFRNLYYPIGHFYSPIVDVEELKAREATLWSPRLTVEGIDFQDEQHRQILETIHKTELVKYDYAEHYEGQEFELRHFYTRNSQFTWLDSRTLFAFLVHWKPRKIVEVGSGFSSLLMADVNQRFLNNECEITCIEPFPRVFLTSNLQGISSVIQKKVQDVPLEVFDQLEAGDILFIDSSHVSKTGSDVNHLFFEVLPRLKSGVRIHIHDIFLPMEYVREWVIDENRSWNEQYLLRALLMYSTAFKVLFGCNYAFLKFPELVQQAINHPKGYAFGGGSFWIERQ